MDTGHRIEYLRDRKGASRRELARAIRVNQSTVAYWERGETFPRRDTFSALVSYLGITQARFYSFRIPPEWMKAKAKKAAR